jgi:hypothetical protein
MQTLLTRSMLRRLYLIGVVLSLLLAMPLATQRSTEASASPFEVWAVDQSGTSGKLYIYQGEDLNDDAAEAIPEVIDLDAAVSSLCQAETGSVPIRGHMLVFSPNHTHAILSYVATGHVVFMDAATRSPLTCIDVGAQAHAAFPFPDGTQVIVANQNGKLLQRISTDYASNTFTLDDAATLDLANCTTPDGNPCEAPGLRPDNAPICPVIDSTSRLVFTTLRGGGMFVVDGTTTPMSIIAEYDTSVVQPEGCGGVEKAGKMYINSGNANPSASHLYAFPLSGMSGPGPHPPNTPEPTVVFSQTDGDFNTHGMALTTAMQGRHLWAADRFANTIEVVDTTTDTLVNTFSLVNRHSSDPAPDLMGVAPDGKYAFISLRGPCPLTANSPVTNNAVGATPGVGVVAIQRGGFSGKLVAVAPITNPSAAFACASVGGSPTLTERADVHGIAVRHK